MKEQMAKMIAGKMKNLDDEQKRGFMEKFYQKVKDKPDCDTLCKQMQEMIDYRKDDYR